MGLGADTIIQNFANNFRGAVMQNRIKFFLMAISVGVLIGNLSINNPRIDAQGRSLAVEALIQAQKIAPAKKLLDAKGVPFSAESLLRPDWKTTLGPVLTQMPEMQVSRSVGNHIDRVQMADTLYLSENVKVTADTVIIARKIVFEGRDAVIKGPHNVYYFPLETYGVLGMSLDEAVGKKFGFTNNEWKSNEAETLKEFTPTLLERDHRYKWLWLTGLG